MDRREAVKYISILLGGTMVGANAILTGCKADDKKMQFSEDDIRFLDEVAETILPTTSTPGAKAAQVGQFMTVMVNDSYEEKNQKIFHDGIDKINKASKDAFNIAFINASPQQKLELLVKLDAEQKDYTKNKKTEDDNHYFRMMKELTLLGYFTSEIGSTQARRYVPVPGRYEGCIPYKKGDKAFA